MPLLTRAWPDGDAPAVRAYAVLCDVLRTDPVLAAAGVTWRVWDGSPSDPHPPARGELPWVRLTPDALPLKLGTESEWEGDFRVKFEAVVEGTAWADLGNLTYYLRRALRYNRAYGDSTVMQSLRAAGLTVHDFADGGSAQGETQADPSQAGGPAVTSLRAVGYVTLNFYESAID